MTITEVYYDEAGRIAKKVIHNALEEFVPKHVKESSPNDHVCFIAALGSGAYQARCGCGMRFGVHRYPLAALAAQNDICNHQMNYGHGDFRIQRIEGIDEKLARLSWE